MRNYGIVCLCLISFILINCSPKTSTTLGERPSEPGKCYAKVQYPGINEEVEKSYIVYTGEDLSQEGLEVTYVEVSPEEKGWVKKKADINCLSPNPDDCLVWCLVKKPAVIDTIVQVRDTSLIKDFMIDTKIIEFPIQDYKVDWAEVHCENNLSKSFINSISTKLVELAYLAEPTSVINKKLQKAIKNYQQDYDLGYGALTVEFTDHLEL
jgi:hypothetical protein